MLLLTALLFLADIALRRLVVRSADVRLAAQRSAAAVGAGLTSVKEAVAAKPVPLSASQADHLLGRKVTERARDLMVKKDIYDLLERIIDGYRDAAGVALQITLKHS